MAFIIRFFLLLFFVHVGHAQILTLTKAIEMALDKNPTLTNATLDRTSQKYSLKVSQQEFDPIFFVSGNSVVVEDSEFTNLQTGTEVGPGGRLRNIYGTEFHINYNYSFEHGVQPVLHLKQHLIRGLNPRANAAALDNAIDQETINVINYQNTIATTISDTVSKYINVIRFKRDIFSAQRSIQVSQREIKILRIKVARGMESKNSLVLKRIGLYNALSNYDLKNSEREIQLNVLKNQIGQFDNRQLELDDNLEKLFKMYPVPTAKQAIQLMLKNDATLLTLELQLKQNKRSLVVAKDNQLWQLDLSTTTDLTDPSDTNAHLQLHIPFNNRSLKQQVVNANVTIKKTIQSIDSRKRTLINEANQTIKSLEFDINAMKNQQNEITRRKLYVQTLTKRLRNNEISVFELNQQIEDREEAEDSYTSTLIDYLDKLIVLYQRMGLTHRQWHVRTS